MKRRLGRLFQLEGEILPFLRPGSWVGGDRDGNPNVSPETLEYAVRHQADWFWIITCGRSTPWARNCRCRNSLVTTSPALRALAEAAANVSAHQGDEPYRRALVACYARMAATRRRFWAGPVAAAALRGAEPMPRRMSFAADLDIIAASLRDNGDADLAEGRLQNLREAVAAFGFHLAAMDVRQNSDVHERAVAELLAVAGVVADYLKLEEGCAANCCWWNCPMPGRCARPMRNIPPRRRGNWPSPTAPSVARPASARARWPIT